MGMPRKGSRKAEVGGDLYLWRVSDGMTRYRNLSGESLHLTVQIDGKRPGRVAQVDLLSKKFQDVDPWSFEHGSGHRVTLTPAEVHTLIEYALDQGWDPHERGPAFQVPPGPKAPLLNDYRIEDHPKAR